MTPTGIRTESNRTPNASRAGALYATQLYSTAIPTVIHLPTYRAAHLPVDNSPESRARGWNE